MVKKHFNFIIFLSGLLAAAQKWNVNLGQWTHVSILIVHWGDHGPRKVIQATASCQTPDRMKAASETTFNSTGDRTIELDNVSISVSAGQRNHVFRGLFYSYRSPLIPAWINNHIKYKVWDEITYPFPNFNAQPLKFGNGKVNSCHTYRTCSHSLLR